MTHPTDRPFESLVQHRLDQDFVTNPYKILRIVADQKVSTQVHIYKHPDPNRFMLVFEDEIAEEEIEILISKWQLARLAKAVAKGFEWMGGE